MIEVYLFEFGYIDKVDLKKVAAKINRSQKEIKVILGYPVTEIKLPDHEDFFYGKEEWGKLFPPVFHSEVSVGITMMPIDSPFFTLSFDNKVVIPLFQTPEICSIAGVSTEDYVVQTLITELLKILYRKNNPSAHFTDLVHTETTGCIFDFVKGIPNMVAIIREGKIEAKCKQKLLNTGVQEKVIKAASVVIRRIQKPPIQDTLSEGLQRPLFGFFFGSLAGGLFINILSSLLLGDFNQKSDTIVIAVLIVLIILLAMSNHLLSSKRV
jgi:hypothetical protein